MTHQERQKWIEEIAYINRKINEESEEKIRKLKEMQKPHNL